MWHRGVPNKIVFLRLMAQIPLDPNAFWHFIKYFTYIISLFGVVFLASGCQQGNIYQENIEFGADGWDADSAYTFKVLIPDERPAYDIVYHIRHNLSYPFYNLYLKYTVADSVRTPYLSDRQQVTLLDEQTGKPRGSGLGGVYGKDFMGIQGIRFRKPGLYRFTVAQYMRRDPLPGIISFGIEVRRQE